MKEGLVEPNFLGIKAFPTGFPSFHNWWDWVLIVIIGVSGIVGTCACLCYSYRSIRGLLSVRIIT